jgi:hypothetical protein
MTLMIRLPGRVDSHMQVDQRPRLELEQPSMHRHLASAFGGSNISNLGTDVGLGELQDRIIRVVVRLG